MEDVVVPVALFSIAPVIVLIVMYFNSRRNSELQQTVREALSQGQELTPETIKALGVRPRKPYCDLRRGLVLLAIAAAFLVLGYGAGHTVGMHNEDISVMAPMAGVAAFPGFIGFVYILMHFFLRGKNDD